MLSTIRSAVSRATHLRRCSTIASISTWDDGGAGASPSRRRTITPPTKRSSTPLKGNGPFHTKLPLSKSHQPHSQTFSSLASGICTGVLSPSRQTHQPRLQNFPSPIRNVARTNFSYAGPRKLSDILKTELLEEKSSAEISDLWMTYHEGKEKVHGLALDEAKGKSILARAAQCPFFLHPVFREEGHFMIISQFQAPNYFLLAFLEDYRLDPARAQPLLTISLFDDMAEKKDVTLVRCDIINRGIEEDEGYKLCQCLLNDYADEEDFRSVHMFNKKPDAFDVDAFVIEKERRWKAGTSSSGGERGIAEGEAIEAGGAESKSDNAV